MDGLMFVHKQEILYALADGNYSLVCLTNGQRFKVLRKLKEVGQLLSDENFIRIHRSHLINLEHVKGYKRGKGGYAQMSNGDELEIAVRRKSDFFEHFSS